MTKGRAMSEKVRKKYAMAGATVWVVVECQEDVDTVIGVFNAEHKALNFIGNCLELVSGQGYHYEVIVETVN